MKFDARQMLIFGLFASVPIVQLLFAVVIWLAIPDPQSRGLFGDMFGAVNALFSGLAFAGIVFTLFQQRKQNAISAAANERAARLSAMSVLVTAYSERARYFDSRASSDSSKVQSYYEKIDSLAVQLEGELELSLKR
jgi:ABC-type multidrug transport system fused ATPase/permease subunit